METSNAVERNTKHISLMVCGNVRVALYEYIPILWKSEKQISEDLDILLI